MISALSLATLPAAPSPTINESLGVCVHLNDSSPAEFPAVRAAGFGAIRTDLTWGEVEPQQGVYRWAKWDRAVDAMKANGIRPLLILFDYNRAYGEGAPRSEEARAGFARFCGLAAARYRGAEFEIWNEPNLKTFWKPAPNPREYVALVKAASAAIRAANPKARILGGSVTEPIVPALEAYLSLGMLDYVDAVSFHPYRPQRPESMLATISQIRALVSVFGKGRPIGLEITEMGYPITYAGQDEARRARYIPRAYLTSLVGGVDRFYVYQWRDNSSPEQSNNGWGINTRELRPLPAHDALRSLATKLRGFSFVRRVSTANPVDYVLLFAKGAERRTVVWTARRDPADGDAVNRSPGLAPMTATPTTRVGGRTVGLSGTPQVIEGP